MTNEIWGFDDMNFAEEVGSNIRDARNAKRLTQRHLAQMVGRTGQSISLYELGKRLPDLETMSCISSILDVTLDDLVPRVSCSKTPLVDKSQLNIYDIIEE